MTAADVIYARMIRRRRMLDGVSHAEARALVDAELAKLAAAWSRAVTAWIEQIRVALAPIFEAMARAYRDAQRAGLVPDDPPSAPRNGPPLPRLDGRRR